MGAPKRNRKHFEKPKERWNIERIKSDNALKDEYGLKNMKELWKVQSEVSRIRGNVRELLSASGTESENVRERIIGRLTKLGLATQSTTLDNLLDLKESNLLDRRLQTIVFKRGMARSAKQARQITVHGFISINGRRVNRPGYMVDVETEKSIGYYKPIDVNPVRTAGPTVAAEPAAESPESKEEKSNA
ncbi:MAG: 30S ribosomal protein S4 [Candidatus Micrarchaeaceae archaeon]|jgi:small subunit ribosomal protein S4|nr:30S ribosomal protein S4 [Candidatus Micrarchaeota archaeon]HII10366.1 30S ribosomal protein S4 [Candidatus Micrarchaeota archaeon]